MLLTPPKSTLTHGVTASKILSSETRFKILYLIMQKRGSDICVKEIADAIGLTHSATSHQLTKLQAQGVVKPSRKGQTMCYHLNDSPITKRVARIIENLR